MTPNAGEPDGNVNPLAEAGTELVDAVDDIGGGANPLVEVDGVLSGAVGDAMPELLPSA